MKYLVSLLLLSFLLLPVTSRGDCLPLPDADLSIAVFSDDSGHAYPLSLMIVPDGSAGLLADARRPDGLVVNGEISVWLYDGAGFPVPGVLPAEMWVGSNDSRLVFCPGANIARRVTDQDGYSWFEGPFAGGGTSEEPLVVFVCGGALVGGFGLPLWINSPDINGDLEVNLADVQLFATDYFGSYAYRSDLSYDGVLNLSDVGRLAQHMGASCP